MTSNEQWGDYVLRMMLYPINNDIANREHFFHGQTCHIQRTQLALARAGDDIADGIFAQQLCSIDLARVEVRYLLLTRFGVDCLVRVPIHDTLAGECRNKAAHLWRG